MDKWISIDYPVLMAAVELCSQNDYSQATCDDIAASTGLDRVEIVKSVRRLGEKYLRVKDEPGFGGADIRVTGVTVDGLVVAEVWPSPDALQKRFISALEGLIVEAPEGSPKASKLNGVLTSVREVSTSIAGNVIGQLISTAIGV